MRRLPRDVVIIIHHLKKKKGERMRVLIKDENSKHFVVAAKENDQTP